MATHHIYLKTMSSSPQGFFSPKFTVLKAVVLNPDCTESSREHFKNIDSRTLLPEIQIHLAWGGSWIWVFFKNSLGGSNMQPG